MNHMPGESSSTDHPTAKDKVLRDLRIMMDDANELLDLTAAQVGEGMTEARGRLSASLTRARGRVEHMQDDVSEATRSVVEASKARVRDNPWTSLGAAALAGFVLGMLIGGR